MPPLELRPLLSSTWPSTSGAAETTPGTVWMRAAIASKSCSAPPAGSTLEMPVEAEDAAHQVGAETAHHATSR